MRKLILLVAVIVVAALLLVLSRFLGSHADVATLPDDTAEAPKGSPSVPSHSGDVTEVDRPPIERTNPDSHRVERADNLTGSLRIRISFAQDPKHEPRELQLRVSDLLGIQRDAHRESAFEYLVPGLAPGEYVVSAIEAASIGTTRRASIEKKKRESLVEIELEPKTSLSIRWRSPEGRGIEAAILDAPIEPGERTLTVRASSKPIDPDGPRPERLQIATLQEELNLVRDEENQKLMPAPRQTSDLRTEPPLSKHPVDDDLFGSLDVPAHPPFEVSAWIGGVLMEAQTVSEGQREVVFTTKLDALAGAHATVSCCIVDDFTNAPVAHARISVGQATGQPDEAEPGCSSIQIDPGWALIQIDTDTVLPAEGGGLHYAPMLIPVHAFAGGTLDLGTIRLSPAQSARLRVVDNEGKPVQQAEITIVRQDSYDGTRAPDDLRRVWSDQSGIATVTRVSRGRYVAMCTSPRLDSPPTVFDGASIASGANGIAAEIVVRPVRQVSLVFDEPPRVGTLMLIETPEGLPVRTLEMDEFGIVPLWLGGTEYRAHLVEDGEPTVSVPFTVNSDPCILRIKR